MPILFKKIVYLVEMRGRASVKELRMETIARWVRTALFALCLMLLSGRPGCGQRLLLSQQKPIAGYRPGEVIIKIRDDLPSLSRALTANSTSTESRNLNALNQQFGVTMAQPVFNSKAGGRAIQPDSPLNNVLLLNLAAHVDETTALRAYASLGEVEYAELNYLYYVFGVPNDPFISSQYALYSQSSNGISAIGGWDIERGKNSVTIAIVDTGVDYNHEDLRGKVIQGYDFANEDYDPMDDNGHGTHVAGIAAATTNNGIGVAGVCQGCSILAIKVISADGSGANSWIANGIANAVSRGANVINLSLGGLDNSNTIRLAIQQATRQNALVTAASGNDGSSLPLYPAALAEVMAVGATNKYGDKASFSNYGSHIAVVAPGEGIYSSLAGNRYDAWNGTSMASPHVAGLAGLIWSRNPSLSNQQVRQIITATARDLGVNGRDTYFGYGEINAQAALSETPDSGGNYTPTNPDDSSDYPAPSTGGNICGRGFTWLFGVGAFIAVGVNLAGFRARRR